MADKSPPPEDALSNLRQRVNAAEARHQASSTRPPDSVGTVAARFGGEFGAAVIVGFLLGYGVDYFFHVAPWGLFIGLGLGFVAGVVNVVRAAQSFNRANPADPNAPSIPDDEED
ncbi:hypothetical protein U91I_03888 [alpha proteobacterium U9-1i]|nr:hypothetical protein U91I_03888 [alpha proteobacterium U9-1i]